jgi:prevent-host-death family protein
MGVAALLKARHVGVRELKEHLSGLLKDGHPIVATDRGTPTHFVVPYDEMIEIVEMLEELSDPALVRRVQETRVAQEKGGWIPASRLLSKMHKRSGA